MTQLLVVYRHKGRGSSCHVEIYTHDDFISHHLDYLDLDSGEEDDMTTRQARLTAEQIWVDQDHLVSYMEEQSDYAITAGIVTVTPQDQWLILFDLDSPACHRGYIDVIPRGIDCDRYVKDHYIDTQIPLRWTETDKIEYQHRLHEVLSKPLDWINRTSYAGLLMHDVTSEFWGWSDGAEEGEPFLGQCDEANSMRLTHGLTRYNLDHLGLTLTS